MDASSTSVGREKLLQYRPSRGTSQTLGRLRARRECAGATEIHPRRRTAAEAGPPSTRSERAGGRAGARAMEQRLAEFREARKRAALVAQPSTTSQGEQTSAAKAEPAAATPKAAPGWLRRFLTGKASPAITRARPSQVQVRREAGTLKLRLRAGPRPTPHKPRPRLLSLKGLPSAVSSVFRLPSG